MKYAVTLILSLALGTSASAGTLLPAEETQAPEVVEAVGGSLGPAVIGIVALGLLVAAGGSSSDDDSESVGAGSSTGGTAN